jgi:hypothetical protein
MEDETYWIIDVLPGVVPSCFGTTGKNYFDTDMDSDV